MPPSMPPSDDRPPQDPPPPISPLVPGRGGRPSVSLAALRERVERQFHAETHGRADILRDLETADAQRALLAEIADYVLALESITLGVRDHAALIDALYRELFTLGPLEPFVADESVTEIAVDGPYHIAIRRGADRLEPVDAAFEDDAHLTRVIERALASAGLTPDDAAPFAEVGARLGGRPARVTLAAPPLAAQHSLQIRLHPSQPHTLEALHDLEMLPDAAITALRAIVGAGDGLLIVGDTGAGKTTLAGALIPALEGPPLVAVERAAELPLPRSAARHTPAPGEPFAATLLRSLDDTPGWLLIDEIRGDESAALWSILTRDTAPPCLAIFRGATQPDRLQSALTMTIRKAHPALEQDVLDQVLAARFPFVATLRTLQGAPRLVSLAETSADADGLHFTPLIAYRDGAWSTADQPPAHPLDLPDAFWT